MKPSVTAFGKLAWPFQLGNQVNHSKCHLWSFKDSEELRGASTADCRDHCRTNRWRNCGSAGRVWLSLAGGDLLGVRGGCSDGLIAGFKCAIHRSSWRPVPYRCDRDSPGLDSRSCCSAVRRCPARIGRVELLVIRFADVGSPIERHDSTASRGHCERGRGRGRNQRAASRASRAGGDPRHLALPHERHVQWICRQSRRCELQRRTTVA